MGFMTVISVDFVMGEGEKAQSRLKAGSKQAQSMVMTDRFDLLLE
jgi:hypothetical protein